MTVSKIYRQSQLHPLIMGLESGISGSERDLGICSWWRSPDPELQDVGADIATLSEIQSIERENNFHVFAFFESVFVEQIYYKTSRGTVVSVNSRNFNWFKANRYYFVFSSSVSTNIYVQLTRNGVPLRGLRLYVPSRRVGVGRKGMIHEPSCIFRLEGKMTVGIELTVGYSEYCENEREGSTSVLELQLWREENSFYPVVAIPIHKVQSKNTTRTIN